MTFSCSRSGTVLTAQNPASFTAGHLAADHVPGATAAATTLVGPSGEPETLATNALALAAEKARTHHSARQFGTCNGSPRTYDAGSEQRLSDLAARARALGITAALTCDLGHHHGSHATLSVYTTAPDGFAPGADLYVELLGAHVEIALEQVGSVASLHTALRSRQMIGEATGILMQRRRLDAADAFTLLKTTSQRTNVKLRTVAEYIVLTGADPDQITRRDLERSEQSSPSGACQPDRVAPVLHDCGR